MDNTATQTRKARGAMPLHPDVERLALIGWRLIPTTRTKKGLFRGYMEAATSDLDTLAAWSREFEGCNWSVVPQGSGVWGLDVDRPSEQHDADGCAALQAMVATNGPLPQRPTGRSGGGGLLLVFRDAGHPIRAKSGWPKPGLDPRAGRNTFTVSPSIHRNGQPYRWAVAPWEIAPPVAPAWLLRAVAPPPEPARPAEPQISTGDRARRRLIRALDAVRNAGPGTRNHTLNRECFAVARHVAAGTLSETEAVEALYAAARSAGLDHLECKDTIRSGFRSGSRHPAEAAR